MKKSGAYQEVSLDVIVFKTRSQTKRDMVTGDKSSIQVLEFLTGRMPSRTHLNQSHNDLNPLLDTTIPAQERTPPVAEMDPIKKLADVLTSMQNRPTTQ